MFHNIKIFKKFEFGKNFRKILIFPKISKILDFSKKNRKFSFW